MSSITLHPASSTRLRLTVRGRRVMAAVAALPAALALSAAVISGGAALADRDGAGATSFETVTVHAGDSLWAIAERVAPASDPRDVIAEIARLNALEGGVVSAGQELAIPTQYTR